MFKTLEDVFRLPSVEFSQKSQLPENSGVYFLVANQQILYLGKAINLRGRWRSHHRKHEANVLVTAGLKVKIHYLLISSQEPSNHQQLLHVEQQLIKQFKPPLNDSPLLGIIGDNQAQNPLLTALLTTLDEHSEKVMEMVKDSVLLLDKGFTPKDIIRAYWMNGDRNPIARLLDVIKERMITEIWNSSIPQIKHRLDQNNMTLNQAIWFEPRS